MAKGLGKVILTSSILAGAALGTYMYFKKEGVIDETKTPSENAVNIRNKVTADAAEYFNKDRSYVDLKEAVEEKAGKLKETAKEAVDTIKETAKETSKKASKKAAEAKEDIAETVEEVKEEIAEKTAEVKEELSKKAEESFEPGLQADKIDAAESRTYGSTSSEEFFNDED